MSTLKPAWREWAAEFGRRHVWRAAYDDAGDPVPSALDELLESEGVDRALLFCEYSPRATGIQPIEDFPEVNFWPRDLLRAVLSGNAAKLFPGLDI